MTRKQRIEHLLLAQFCPTLVEVKDESHKHHVPQNLETHINVLVVSVQFESMSLMARHRAVNQLLKDELNQGLHALSMHLLTPKEWESKNKTSLNTPACRDGYDRSDSREGSQ